MPAAEEVQAMAMLMVLMVMMRTTLTRRMLGKNRLLHRSGKTTGSKTPTHKDVHRVQTHEKP